MDSEERVPAGSSLGNSHVPTAQKSRSASRIRDAVRSHAGASVRSLSTKIASLRAILFDPSLPSRNRSLAADALSVILFEQGQAEASHSNLAWRLWNESQNDTADHASAEQENGAEHESQLATLLSHRGILAWSNGEREVAYRLFTAALRLEQRGGDLQGQAADWGNLGALSAAIGDFPTAIRQLARAWRLHRLVEDGAGLANDLFHLGQIAWEMGRLDSASRLLRRAAALFVQQGELDLACTASQISENALRMRAVQRDTGSNN